MASLSADSGQLDMFEGVLTPDWIHGEKIKDLETKQHALRKALFKRWKEQENRIEKLSTSFDQLLKVMNESCE